MLDRMLYKAYKASWNAKYRLNKIANGETEDSEDGMETIEVIIIVAIAIVIAALIVNFLTKDGFQKTDGTKCGLVQYVFDQVQQKLTGIFSSDTVT